MSTVVNVVLLIAALAALLLALLGLVAVTGRTAGYAWTRGALRAQRAVVVPPGTAHGHTPGRSDTRPGVAPPTGGVCIVGHYVAPGASLCRLQHRYCVPRTHAATPDEITKASYLDAAERENERDRMAAGGW